MINKTAVPSTCDIGSAAEHLGQAVYDDIRIWEHVDVAHVPNCRVDHKQHIVLVRECPESGKVWSLQKRIGGTLGEDGTDTLSSDE
jgi:hypothetical protein